MTSCHEVGERLQEACRSKPALHLRAAGCEMLRAVRASLDEVIQVLEKGEEEPGEARRVEVE